MAFKDIVKKGAIKTGKILGKGISMTIEYCQKMDEDYQKIYNAFERRGIDEWSYEKLQDAYRHAHGWMEKSILSSKIKERSLYEFKYTTNYTGSHGVVRVAASNVESARRFAVDKVQPEYAGERIILTTYRIIQIDE